MSMKLYVGNLSFTSSEEDIRALFAQAGNVVSVTLIKDRETNRSRGFAFVEMGTQEEAEKAISMFNGYRMENRALTVNIARPREEGQRGGFGDRPPRRDRPERSDRGYRDNDRSRNPRR